MKTTIYLDPLLFANNPKTLLVNKGFNIQVWQYASGVKALEIQNTRGSLIILPFMGQMIWRATFDGIDLTMKSYFEEPKPANVITETYGCFFFHSGLLANGCPSSEDTHPLHGEFSCAMMDSSHIICDETSIEIVSEYTFRKGFTGHYKATASIRLEYDKSYCDIALSVQNLSQQLMPLCYMAHLNFAYVENGVMEQNIPDHHFMVRESIPSHLHPTERWLAFNEQVKQGKVDIHRLHDKAHFFPEMVYFVDELPKETIRCTLTHPDRHQFFVEFDPNELPKMTRWIYHSGDEQVAAFALPAIARPEGFSAAQRNGDVMFLKPMEQKHFTVRAGLCD